MEALLILVAIALVALVGAAAEIFGVDSTDQSPSNQLTGSP
jgi:hypothetical protein